MKEEIIQKVHVLANKRLFEEYPCLSQAKEEEGSIKKWQVEFVLRAYDEMRQIAKQYLTTKKE